MKNSTIIGGILFLVILIGGFVFVGSHDKGVSGNVVNSGNGDVQKITLSIKDYNYYPQEIRVKVNQLVSISLDSSVTGCFRYLTIKELGLAKNLATPQDTLDFTPTQKGEYTFACSMGMGYGKLIV